MTSADILGIISCSFAKVVGRCMHGYGACKAKQEEKKMKMLLLLPPPPVSTASRRISHREARAGWSIGQRALAPVVASSSICHSRNGVRADVVTEN